jgi:ABC-2 type transport system ATP-binding protein
VRVCGLQVSFGAVAAVTGVDLEVAAGAALALVGRNGAGKSTTMRVLAGVLPADAGTVWVGGVDVRHDPAAGRRQVGYCPDVGGLIPRATAWEHLQLAARLRGLTGWHARARELLDGFDLGGAADRVCGTFSHGMGRRMSVLLAMFHEPAVLLLDEPFDGVDPLGVAATLTGIEQARARGAAVLVSTHLLPLATRAAPMAAVLRSGGVVRQVASELLSGPAGAARYEELLAR